MKVKIKLQTEKTRDLELDLYGAYTNIPIVLDNKMILGSYISFVYLLNRTFNQLPEELKKILNERKTKSFYLKHSILTITELTAYQIRIGNINEGEICAEKVFDNFDENKGIFLITSTCNFPYKSMGMYFQTAGDIFLEFNLEDVFFGESIEYEMMLKKSKEIKEINKEKPSNFLENIHNRKFRK